MVSKSTLFPSTPEVLFRCTKSTMSIILNRPHVLNSLNIEMIDIITDYLKGAFADKKCRVVLFYGSGNKGFCAGGDVKELAQKGKEKAYDEVSTFFKKE